MRFTMFLRGKKGPASLIVLALCAGVFCASPGLAQQVGSIGNFSDVIDIGMSARPLGMGRAFVAFSDSVESAFLNPAGMSRVQANSFTTMFSSVLQDVNYSVLAGAWPQKERGGVLGAGAVMTNVSGITQTGSMEVLGQIDSRTNLFFLSYAMRLDQFYKMYPGLVPVALVPGGDLTKVEMGGTLKYFSVDHGVARGVGSGFDLDLGILYAYSPGITIGAMGRNILPDNWGGKISYDSGVTDTLASEFKAGLKINLFGEAGKAFNEGTLPVDVGIDFDYMPGGRNLWHYGAEAWLSPALAVRVGVDQAFGATGLAQNIAAGIGYQAGDYGLQYAFHPFNGIQQNATHFFSINFLGTTVPQLIEKILPTITLSQEDKSIVQGRRLEVGGVATGLPDGTIVNISGNDTQVKDGKIAPVTVLMRPGKNALVATAKAPDGKKIEAKSRVLRLLSFQDIPDQHWAKRRIELAATAGLIEGFPDGTFRPDRDLSRAELSAIIIRNEGTPLPSVAARDKIFKDLAGTHWAARYIKVANDKQLVRGYLDGTFRANNPITKAETVTLAVRYNRLAGGSTFIRPVAESPFLDVPIRHWASRSISDAQNDGMLEYVQSDFFEPNKAITRAESVEILTKTVQGKQRIEKLMNWDEGF